MSERSARDRRSEPESPGGSSAGLRLSARFWDEVEREIEEIDWLDFAEFAEAGGLDIEPRPGFEDRLREGLLARVRRRYTT